MRKDSLQKGLGLRELDEKRSGLKGRVNYLEKQQIHCISFSAPCMQSHEKGTSIQHKGYYKCTTTKARDNIDQHYECR